MDPNNPVVKLCMEGLQAEAEHRFNDARDLFMQAWTSSKDDYEACMSAHCVARHQESFEDTLHWNQEALNRADAVGDDRVRSFYPSLYLNLGYSHEVLGNRAEANRYYELAAERCDALPEGSYGDLVRSGIANGRKRISSAEG